MNYIQKIKTAKIDKMRVRCMLKQVKSDGTIKTIPLYYKQNQISRKYYAFWKKESESPVISNFANILKEMF